MKRTFLLLPWLLLTSMHEGQAQKLTIDDLLGAGAGAAGRRVGVGEGLRSPDGRYLLGLQNNQLVVTPADGNGPELLDGTPGAKSEFQWSRDSSHRLHQPGNVWVVDVTGRAAHHLTHDPKGVGDPRGATDHHPEWNPNGRWILYKSGQHGYNELYAVSDDGKVLNRIAATEIYRGADALTVNVAQDRGDAVSPDRFDSHPQWSPDGTRVSYTERSREFFSGKLNVLAFDQKNGTAIESALDLYVAKNDPGGAWAIDTATWSPDSKTLAIVLQETRWDKIWLISAKGGKPRELTFGTGEDEQPLYSPDGKWIVFESNRGLPEQRHPWVVPAGGGQPHRLTKLDGIEGEPEWSDDSQFITFSLRTTLGASAKYVAGVAANSEVRLLGQVRHSRFEVSALLPRSSTIRAKMACRLLRSSTNQPATNPASGIPRSFWRTEAPKARCCSVSLHGPSSWRTTDTS